MIESAWAAMILSTLGRKTDCKLFRPLHQIVRSIDANLLPRIVCASALGMRELRGVSFALESRHSSTGSPDFNVFYSDVDLSAYLSETDMTEANFAALRKLISELRKGIPFIGELEVYSWEEKKELGYWMERAGRIYGYLRDLRKIGWMETAFANAQTFYHRQKAIRAIRLCVQRVASDVPARSTANFSRIGSGVSAYISSRYSGIESCADDLKIEEALFSPYYGGFLSTEKGAGEAAVLRVSPGVLIFLLAVSPILRCGNEDVQRFIDALRERGDIRSLWRALSEIEAITCKGVSRASEEKPEWMRNWQAWTSEAVSCFSPESMDSI